MIWFKRSAVLVLAVAAVIGFAMWWHSSFLADVWGPVDAGGGHGRSGGLGLGIGRGRAGGGHAYSDAWAPIVSPMLIIAAAVVVGDWFRLRLKRARRRSLIAN